MKPTSLKRYLRVLFFFILVWSPFSLFDKHFNRNFPWNKTDKTPTFNGIPPHVPILTMLEAIRTYQDGMADEVSENIIAELRKIVGFSGFSEERMK